MENRHIAHLDMDAFYASVELLRYPELRGSPVVIGGRSVHRPILQQDGTCQFAKLREYSGRGVVTTSTYEARAYGIFSAMGIMQAAKLAPDAILLPADFDAYRHYSRLFKRAVAKLVPHVEDRGIDEIYIDLSPYPSDKIASLVLRIKQAVHATTGLSCSIGIAPNKLLAKICSDLEKPDGLTILQQTDIPNRIWPLPVHKINGIGPKAKEKLARLGIHTIGELARAELILLQAHFGQRYAFQLHHAAHGHDDRPVVTNPEPRSISRETTFERDLHARRDRKKLSYIFTELCTRVAEDLHRKGYVGRTIGIKLRYKNFQTVTRDQTLRSPTADAPTIRRTAGNCLRRVPLEQELRLLGVRVSALSRADALSEKDHPFQEELFYNQ
ncbi:DNA polymerase IV [Nitrosomonas sp. HPC101]|uniref:DNA polymerase IV n=1 Tax=Nitrosomonas sp. HPC101 TaxID=1658667 RepID=UPI001368289C|nr:DNA polymerase IV [Nitrosomonas sp. HPC101]MXS84510.1 DNA polymerase IV [Nitrosomonas sp. HPC101]